MPPFHLPPLAGAPHAPALPESHLYTIVGANGSGKSRFMERLGQTASAPSAYISPVADRLPFATVATPLPPPAFRERIGDIWGRLFPGSVVKWRGEEAPLFANAGAPGDFPASRLSRGEKTAFHFLCAVASAPQGTTLFIDAPSLFVHPSLTGRLWEEIRSMRRDCRMVFDTNDPLFVASLRGSAVIWIRSWRPGTEEWDYEILTRGDLPDDILVELLGSRRPVLFIEGDAAHSIDARLYAALFPEYTVRPVGSCNRVIEATRTFAAFSQMHRLESHGLVDRDRRTDNEVDYLRRKGVMVPEVAEVENIFLSEPVVRLMAEVRGRNPESVMRRVRRAVLQAFREQLTRQALEHTRHIMKRDVERKIDARFTCITALELHIKGLIHKLRPRDHYDALRASFERMHRGGDYAGILKVFNLKSMLPNSGVAAMLGYGSAEQYVEGVISTLRGSSDESPRLRAAVRGLFPAPGDATESPSGTL